MVYDALPLSANRERLALPPYFLLPRSRRELVWIHQLAVLYYGWILRFNLVQSLDIPNDLDNSASALQAQGRLRHQRVRFCELRSGRPVRAIMEYEVVEVDAKLDNAHRHQPLSELSPVAKWPVLGRAGQIVLATSLGVEIP